MNTKLSITVKSASPLPSSPAVRCTECNTGRLSGEPCNLATCLCACHRGRSAAATAAIYDPTLTAAREARGFRRTLNLAIDTINIERKEKE